MKRSFLLLAVLLTALPALAQEAAPPRFLIERIEVRNARRVSPDVVISESLLQEGQEYSELELSAAAARLNRLPFLLSADFSLEKGSSRGRHVLVITIAETKPFFYLFDARPLLKENRNRQTLVDYADSLGAETNEAAVGVRHFLGRRGVVHAGLTSRRDRQVFTTDYSAVAAGYTRYDILGTNAFATINLRVPFGETGRSSISPQLVVGVPLTSNQTLSLNYEETRFRPETEVVSTVNIRRQDAERLIALTWTYNTTNAPFVPTSGTMIRIAPLWAMRDRSSDRTFGVGPGPRPAPTAYAQHINGHGVDLTATRYWELSDRDAVSAGVKAGWAKMEDRLNSIVRPSTTQSRPTYRILHAAYSYNLWHGQQRNGDSRLEAETQHIRRNQNYEPLSGAASYYDVDHFRSSLSWVRRSSWGTFRIGGAYEWD